jgi:hypothetical protein
MSGSFFSQLKSSHLSAVNSLRLGPMHTAVRTIVRNGSRGIMARIALNCSTVRMIFRFLCFAGAFSTKKTHRVQNSGGPYREDLVPNCDLFTPGTFSDGQVDHTTQVPFLSVLILNPMQSGGPVTIPLP